PRTSLRRARETDGRRQEGRLEARTHAGAPARAVSNEGSVLRLRRGAARDRGRVLLGRHPGGVTADGRHLGRIGRHRRAHDDQRVPARRADSVAAAALSGYGMLLLWTMSNAQTVTR